jgi:hypothetical protein
MACLSGAAILEWPVAGRPFVRALSTNTPIPKSAGEIRNALTAWRHSPEKRRIQANGHRRGLTEAFTTTLRDTKGRTESSGNVCSNWGYLAEERKTDGVNQQGVGVRRDRIWLPTLDAFRTFTAICPTGMLPGFLSTVSRQIGASV